MYKDAEVKLDEWGRPLPLPIPWFLLPLRKPVAKINRELVERFVIRKPDTVPLKQAKMALAWIKSLTTGNCSWIDYEIGNLVLATFDFDNKEKRREELIARVELAIANRERNAQ